VARLDRLEFNILIQLDNSFKLQHYHDHHHFPADDDDYDNDEHCSHNDNLAGIQWVASIL